MIVVVGEVIVDVSLDSAQAKLRLGGVMHACRTLWAMGIPYRLSYIAPEYLDAQIVDYARAHGAAFVEKIGNVHGSPNVILVRDLQEVASQGYELLLRDEYLSQVWSEKFERQLEREVGDVLIFPGQYDIHAVLDVVAAAPPAIDLHIDWSNTSYGVKDLLSLSHNVKTLFTSTSTELFLERSKANPKNLISDCMQSNVESLILKENRGGAVYAERRGRSYTVGAQLREVAHSVGVGDCFDAAFVAMRRSHDVPAALSYAAWIAAEYAVTTYPDDFKVGTQRCLEIKESEILEIPGVRLGWGERDSIHIYIAGPDFDYLDVTAIDRVDGALRYHNFRPHRPIKENGQAPVGATRSQRQELYNQDIELIDRCQVVVGVLEEDDPGTLVEIGLAAAMGKRVLLFDPKRRVANPMLIGAADAICHSLDELLFNLFRICGRAEVVHECA